MPSPEVLPSTGAAGSEHSGSAGSGLQAVTTCVATQAAIGLASVPEQGYSGEGTWPSCDRLRACTACAAVSTLDCALLPADVLGLRQTLLLPLLAISRNEGAHAGRGDGAVPLCSGDSGICPAACSRPVALLLMMGLRPKLLHPALAALLRVPCAAPLIACPAYDSRHAWLAC